MQRPRWFSTLVTASSLAALASLASLSTSGCASGERDSNSPSRPLPAYTGHATELFDDAIEPSAVGMDLDRSYIPKSDPKLRERSQVGDAVIRVRVATVTSKKDGPDSTFQIGLHSVEKLAGSNPPTTDFTVNINKTSESHAIMRNFDARLVGYAFVAFVREFVRSDGDREVHFHLAPDTRDVKAAVGDAAVLGELK